MSLSPAQKKAVFEIFKWLLAFAAGFLTGCAGYVRYEKGGEALEAGGRIEQKIEKPSAE